MRRYAITEGLGAERALRFVAHNLERRIEMIQIREKALSPADLRDLIAAGMGLAKLHTSSIFVNGVDDFGAHGVHLPAGLRSRDKLKPVPHGASCHSVTEVEEAERDGAQFVVFGPVFKTGDKTPVGLQLLTAAASAVRIPVFALGGVTEENATSCISAGAAGIAGIRLFRP